MNLAVAKAPAYFADVTRQFGWYFAAADEQLAWRLPHGARDLARRLLEIEL